MIRRSIIAFFATLSLASTVTLTYASDWMLAEGDFTASVNFPTLTLTPLGANCILEVEGELEFTGTLEGIANGITRALVLASCDAVAITPPGTFKDVFKSKLEFIGMVDGKPVIADVTYRGITKVGGDINAQLHFTEGLKGVLKVDAIVAVGGSYRGLIEN